jgi:hypothetical protein
MINALGGTPATPAGPPIGTSILGIIPQTPMSSTGIPSPGLQRRPDPCSAHSPPTGRAPATRLAPQPEARHIPQEPEADGLPGQAPGPLRRVSPMGARPLPSRRMHPGRGKSARGRRLHQVDPSHRRGPLLPGPGLQRAADVEIRRLGGIPVTHTHTRAREGNPPGAPAVPSAPAGHSTVAT